MQKTSVKKSAKKPTKNRNEQTRRFIEKARELGCDEDPKAFERNFNKVVPPKRPKPQKPTADEREKKP